MGHKKDAFIVFGQLLNNLIQISFRKDIQPIASLIKDNNFRIADERTANDDFLLLPPVVIEPLQKLKTENLGNQNPRLHADEILLALAISATTNPMAALAMEQLPKLKGLQAHVSVIVSGVDKTIYRKLGIDLTCEPVYERKKLYHK